MYYFIFFIVSICLFGIHPALGALAIPALVLLAEYIGNRKKKPPN